MDGRAPGIQSRTPVRVGVRPVISPVRDGEQFGVGRVATGEPHPFRSEPVEVRRAQGLVAKASQVPIAKIVADDEEDVGAFRRGIGGVEHRQWREQKGGEGCEGVFHDVVHLIAFKTSTAAAGFSRRVMARPRMSSSPVRTSLPPSRFSIS